MAANIKIALELDDRGYVQGLKSSVDQTKNLAKETEKLGNSGGASFGKMNTSLMAVGNNIKGLIAGYVGLQSVMASFRMADDINDLIEISMYVNSYIIIEANLFIYVYIFLLKRKSQFQFQ